MAPAIDALVERLRSLSSEVKSVGFEAATLTQYLTYGLQAAGRRRFRDGGTVASGGRRLPEKRHLTFLVPPRSARLVIRAVSSAVPPKSHLAARLGTKPALRRAGQSETRMRSPHDASSASSSTVNRCAPSEPARRSARVSDEGERFMA